MHRARKYATSADELDPCTIQIKENTKMLWTIVIILLVLWALGFGFGALGNIVHLLLVVAVVMVVVQLIQRRGA